MKHSFKKLMSLVLSLVLMVQLVPVSAFAEGTDPVTEPQTEVSGTVEPTAEPTSTDEPVVDETEEHIHAIDPEKYCSVEDDNTFGEDYYGCVGCDVYLNANAEVLYDPDSVVVIDTVITAQWQKGSNDWTDLSAGGEVEDFLGNTVKVKFFEDGNVVSSENVTLDTTGFATPITVNKPTPVTDGIIELTLGSTNDGTDRKSVNFTVNGKTFAVTLSVLTNGNSGGGGNQGGGSEGNTTGGNGNYGYYAPTSESRNIVCIETERNITLGGTTTDFRMNTAETEQYGNSVPLKHMHRDAFTSGFAPVYIFRQEGDKIVSLADVKVENGETVFTPKYNVVFTAKMLPYISAEYKLFAYDTETGRYKPTTTVDGSVAVLEVKFKADGDVAIPKSLSSSVQVYIFNHGDLSTPVASGDISVMGDGYIDRIGDYDIILSDLPDVLVDNDSSNDSQAFGLGITTYKTKLLTTDTEAKTVSAYFIKRTLNSDGEYSYSFASKSEIASVSITSNNKFVTIGEIKEETLNGKTVYGVTATMATGEKELFDEAKVTYKVVGKDQPVTLYWAFSRVQPDGQVTVTDEEGFRNAYDSMSSGTIIVKEKIGEDKNYYMDLNLTKGIQLLADGEVVIAGDKESNGAIITLHEAGANNRFEGFIINGQADSTKDKRVGMDANGWQVMYSGLTFEKCSIGITSSKAGNYGFRLFGSTFNNNDTAIALNDNAMSVTVNGCTFEGNGTAISLDRNTYQAGDPTKGCTIVRNVFKNNTVDFVNNTNYEYVIARQNYFYHPQGEETPAEKVNVPKIQYTEGKDGIIYYTPYYTTETFTNLSGDIKGAEGATADTGISAQADAKELTVPVDLTISDKSTVFDKALFEEIKANSNDYTVTIPVTEVVDEKTVVSTVWSLSEDTLMATLPANMNLKVTDELTTGGKGEEIVNNKLADKNEIIQSVHFEHNGDLPGKSTVKVLKTSTDTTTDGLKLYYLNTTTNTVEEAEFSQVTVDGEYYVITVDHCSEYIISTGITLKTEDSGSTGGDNTGSGSTGDSTGGTTTGGTTTTTPAPTATPAPTVSATPAPTTKPEQTEDVNANEFVDAVEVQEKFDNSSSQQITIDVSEKSLVSAKAFEILADTEDKELVIEGENFKWTFKAEDITDPDAISGSVFNPEISLESPNADLIGQHTEGAEVINLYFSYHGKLPGKAEVSVNVGAENAGKTMYLYYFNAETGRMEYLGEVVIGADGDATFTIDHCSDYILSPVKLTNAVTAEDLEDTTNKPTQPTQPEENKSSMGMLPLIAIVVGAVVVAVAFIAKKKKAE